MRNTLLLFGLTLSIGTLFFFNNSYLPHSYATSNGSVGAKTDSPLDAASCNSCHTGTVTQSNHIEIMWPGNNQDYIPGQKYVMSINLTDPSLGPTSKNGFEITAETNNAKAGTFGLLDPSITKLVNNNTAVTHINAATNGQNIWPFEWTAPPAGSGTVTFYATSIKANINNAPSGDITTKNSLTINEGQATGILNNTSSDIKIFPMPATVNSPIYISSLNTLDKITIYNSNGKTTQQFRPTETTTTLKINTPGIYLLQLQQDEKITTKKIIIH